MEVYKIEKLNFKYPLGEGFSLKDINLNIEKGEFLTIVGKSGSGKTSLLRQLKPSLSPHGEKKGRISFQGKDLEKLTRREEASKIGYIMQNPDNQIVTDKVWHELAFGLENLAMDRQAMRLRVGEMASYFGIDHWFNKRTSELSGGQKQLLNLASIMAMQPEVLILDEPTSQLDPIAASDFINTLRQINRDLGISIIMTEHRLEEIIAISDRILVMDQGRILSLGEGKKVAEELDQLGHPSFKSMPVPTRIGARIGSKPSYPLTVREGRVLVENLLADIELPENYLKEEEGKRGSILLELEEIYFKYDRKGEDVLSNLSLKIEEGKILSILGGNASGKSTLLSLISGLEKPYRGRILGRKKDLKIGLLPQDPRLLFLEENLKDDLLSLGKEAGDKLEELLELLDLKGLENMHPYDLSGGEQQRLALGKILLQDPDLILLDEPSKGMDNFFKEKFGKILEDLKKKGKTIVLVSHDIEFSCKFSDRSALLFNGEILTEDLTRNFFAGNAYYTSSANKIARNITKYAVLEEDVIQLWEKKKKRE